MFASGFWPHDIKVDKDDFILGKTTIKTVNNSSHKFRKDTYFKFYYIGFNDEYYSYLIQKMIAHRIGISWENYLEIITNCGAFEWDLNFYFKTKKAAERAIAQLEPIWIMKKICT